jgi:molecular chaperone DnaK
MLIIGIDFGNSTSLAAICRDGRVELIQNTDPSTLPSAIYPTFVAVTADGHTLVGEAARRQAAANPAGTLTAFKNRIGNPEHVVLRGHSFTPQRLASLLIERMRQDAAVLLGQAPDGVVIGVPTLLDHAQQAAMIEAGRLAGFECVHLVQEPIAAALAHEIGSSGAADSSQRTMVADLGGAELHVSIVEGWGNELRVTSALSNPRVGGRAMDDLIVAHVAAAFRKAAGGDIMRDPRAAWDLWLAAEVAKIELTSGRVEHITLALYAEIEGTSLHTEIDLSRGEVESMVAPLLEQCRRTVQELFTQAKLGASDINHLILVGGPTKMPVVARLFEEVALRPAETKVDPVYCVAFGAAMRGAEIAGGRSARHTYTSVA